MSSPSVVPPYIRGLFTADTEPHETPENPPFGELVGLGTALERAAHEPGGRRQILLALLGLTAGERAFIVTRSAEAAEGEWMARAAVNFEGEEIINPEEKLVTSLLDRCMERATGYLTLDLQAETEADQLQRERQPRTRSLLIVPLADSGDWLYIDHRFQALALDPNNYFRLVWLFTLLAYAETVREQHAERNELDRELKEARRSLRSRRSSPMRVDYVVGTSVPKRDPRGFNGDFSEIVGSSPQLLEILQILDKISDTNATVLVYGESGTGKELIARSIHKNSSRGSGPFVSENCAALAETLLETELFGHMKGAYTGATEDRPGLFEIASGGTLFLDEIGDTSPEMQKKLLRVLQEGVIRRVGGGDFIEVDVRIISATNKDLAQEVERGGFREDLYYRLNVINIPLPPLRSRIEDLVPLVDHLLAQLNRETGKLKRYNPDFIQAISGHDWPGNIRELQNQIRRVYALSDDVLDATQLSGQVARPAPASSPGALTLERILQEGSLREATERLEREIITACLERFGGNKAQVCGHLRIPKTTLYAKLKRYGIHAGD